MEQLNEKRDETFPYSIVLNNSDVKYTKDAGLDCNKTIDYLSFCFGVSPRDVRLSYLDIPKWTNKWRAKAINLVNEQGRKPLFMS